MLVLGSRLPYALSESKRCASFFIPKAGAPSVGNRHTQKPAHPIASEPKNRRTWLLHKKRLMDRSTKIRLLRRLSKPMFVLAGYITDDRGRLLRRVFLQPRRLLTEKCLISCLFQPIIAQPIILADYCADYPKGWLLHQKPEKSVDNRSSPKYYIPITKANLNRRLKEVKKGVAGQQWKIQRSSSTGQGRIATCNPGQIFSVPLLCRNKKQKNRTKSRTCR